MKPETGRQRQRDQVVIVGKKLYVLDGDILLDDDGLEVYELEQQIRYAEYVRLARSDMTEALGHPDGAGTSA